MNITIVGTGYVGLVTGACLAELGHHVLCLDLDEAKVRQLAAGRMPIHEAGLPALVARNAAAGRLAFGSDVAAAVAFGDLQFIAVGTPQAPDGGADLRAVEAAARAIGRHMDRFKVVVQKSTVPVGTGERVAALVRHELQARGQCLDFAVVSNPEFLKEGAAVRDFLQPDRILLGVDDDAAGRRALLLMRQLYLPLQRERDLLRVMDRRSAELTKYAANAMLATRISFMNELANLAERLGADIELVRQGMGADPRIGPAFLQAGIGYGGSCFPKDVEALCHAGVAEGRRLRLLEAVQAVNRAQPQVLLDKVLAHFGPDLRGRRFAVHGLAFKPGTDDMRDAPSRPLVAGLLRAGAVVVAHDPVARASAARAFAQDLADAPALRERLHLVGHAQQALHGADALLLVTEWHAYRRPPLALWRERMRTPMVFDGRNLYDPQAMAAAGITCIGIGRGSLAPREVARPRVSGGSEAVPLRRRAGAAQASAREEAEPSTGAVVPAASG